MGDGKEMVGEREENDALGQAHSPAIEQSLKTTRLAGLPPPLRFRAP
jgi:hypothetical protein